MMGTPYQEQETNWMTEIISTEALTLMLMAAVVVLVECVSGRSRLLYFVVGWSWL
jgi:hypothetical protein